MAQTTRDLLEQDLVDFPDEHGEILLEIAHEHLHEGTMTAPSRSGEN